MSLSSKRWTENDKVHTVHKQKKLPDFEPSTPACRLKNAIPPRLHNKRIIMSMSVLRRLGARLSNSRPTVLVIGGGATGTGIAAEAARRGFKVTLVERGNLGCGTSSHFHGILHSGARYAVNDRATAAECYQENQFLRTLIPSAVHDTGGIFIALNSTEAAHGDTWLKACQVAGIPVQEISPSEALRREPALSPEVQRAFLVPDGFIDGAEVIQLNRHAAESAAVSATILEHTAVEKLTVRSGQIRSADLRDTRTGARHTMRCDYVLNASGVWSGRVAELAGVPLHMIFDKGTMITFRDEFTRAVINRCRPESDGDLLVPSGHGSILGTTARIIPDPDKCLPTQEEVDALMREGKAIVPALARAEATYIYAGVRPLFSPSGKEDTIPSAGTRGISRSFHVLDHVDDGVSNFISVIGGKVTLYRRMAVSTVDMLALKSGQPRQTTLSAVRASAAAGVDQYGPDSR